MESEAECLEHAQVCTKSFAYILYMHIYLHLYAIYIDFSLVFYSIPECVNKWASDWCMFV